MATLQLKPAATTVLLVCFIIFATQGVMARKVQQQQAVFLAAAATDHNVSEMDDRSMPIVEEEAELRIVPSGPDPLHHHRAVLVVPLLTKKIVKKRVKKFKRPQWDRKICVKTNWRRPKGINSRVRRKFKRPQWDRKICVKTNWRRPKGIDSRVRRESLRVSPLCPTLVVGQTIKPATNPTASRSLWYTMSRSLEVLMMHNRTYWAEIAHNLSTRKRKEMVERAAQLDIVVTNKLARLRSQEDE